MTTVPADAIRSSACATGDDVIMAARDGEVSVMEAAQAESDPSVIQMLYTQAKLLQEYGEEVTDAEAITLAASLTATIAR